MSKLYAPHQKQLISILSSNPDLSDSILNLIADYTEQEILPKAIETDQKKTFPRKELDELARNGYRGMHFPAKYGGNDAPYLDFIAALEIISQGCASTAISMAIHTTASEGILTYGNEKQKEKYLEGLVEGPNLAAFALTEAQGGSDAKAMRTKAVLKDDYYIINGTKMFITNAGEADVYFLFAKTDNGISAFLMDKDTEGFSLGQKIEKLGVRGSTTYELVFENAIIPKENLIGEEGVGFKYAKEMLNGGRLTIAALSIGIAQRAYEESLQYSKEREVFDKPLSEKQITRFKLADMLTNIYAARSLTYTSAKLKEIGKEIKDIPMLCAIPKLFASEMAMSVSGENIQIHGAYGYSDDFNVHRHWRDAQVCTIGEATSEILRELIAHFILK